MEEESPEVTRARYKTRLAKNLHRTRLPDGTWLRCYNKCMIPNIGLVPGLALPTLLQDIFNKADKWGNDGENGRIDPFIEIYHVSFLCGMIFFFGIGAEFLPFSARFHHDYPCSRL